MVTAAERCEMVAALRPVDGVFLISGPPCCRRPPPTATCSRARSGPLAFTEGDPAEGGQRAVAAALGADVLEMPHVQGRSTTWLLGRLIDRSARSASMGMVAGA